MSEAWNVYGRTEYAEPLVEQAALEDPPPGEIAERALGRCPGEWVELVAFPAGAAHWIVRDGEEVERGRAVRALDRG